MGFLVVAGCSSRQESADESAGSAGGREVAAKGGKVVPIVDRESGVRFNPPQRWNNGLLVVDTLNDTDTSLKIVGASYGVAFEYRAEQPGHRNQGLLHILVFSRERWAELSAETGPPQGDSLTTVGDWVYVASLPQSNPYREESLDADQFEQMSITLEEVRAAFAVEGDGPSAPAVGSR